MKVYKIPYLEFSAGTHRTKISEIIYFFHYFNISRNCKHDELFKYRQK